ncbi:NAD(P)-dependent oxidoreductase [Paraflavitalea pollutisoli]|uniref:NAD(P)-dependent oxidoreductase n=1 Tax=Paraflavitalea pollutisoli TaxID=3034143 RepID=UPI0023EACE2F|nr:NAD(P)H-binding protein [Paraflavitalea sp. H1-2-19X]
MSTPTIAVIGGTGKSGQFLVQQLVQDGFHIRLLVRNPAHALAASPQLTIVPGEVSNYHSILHLLQGCIAIISTLGFGLPASAPTIFTQSTTHVLEAMQAHGISRYILTTGLMVDTPFDRKGEQTMSATNWMRQTYPASTTNKQEEYELLATSTLDWTMARLPVIEQATEAPPIVTSLEDCPGNKISASSLARFLIDQLNDKAFFRKAPFIANAP